MKIKNQDICLLTVANQSYLPTALLLLKSFLQHNLESRCFIFVFDVFDAKGLNKGIDERVSLFGLNDLTEQKDLFIKKAQHFNLFEMANLAKYIGIRHVQSSYDEFKYLVYADTDMKFYSSICKFIEPLKEDKVAVFTPHSLNLFSMNYAYDFLKYSGINSGIFALNLQHEEAANFLCWIIKAVRSFGLWEPHLMFADQAVIGLAATKLGQKAHLSSLKAVNVAYWNVRERKISNNGSHVYADGERLICFHFSGFSKENKEKISLHSGDRLTSDDDALIAILNDYRYGIVNLSNRPFVNAKSNQLTFSTSCFPLRLIRAQRFENVLAISDLVILLLKWVSIRIGLGIISLIPRFIRNKIIA